MQSLAVNLVSRYKLHDKTIIEVGCGKGEFLKMLCELGHNRGVGFDPSYVEERGVTTEQVTFIQDLYSERYANYQGDLVCSRHVLEHIQYPAELVASLRRSIGDRSGTVVFFEVPSVTWILRNLVFWDIFYEHCSYFSPGSLTRLFTVCGFDVVRVTEAFGGQYLCLEAFPQDEAREAELAGLGNPQKVADAVVHFATHCQDRMKALQRQLFDGMKRGDRRCVIWGAGAKGVTLLNTLDIPLECIEFVVDINPRKQGMYVPGSGQQIVPPDFLKTYLPNTIFVMNPNYYGEIQDTVASMGICAELISL
jgi:SAM-dependent methyltransferase